MILLAGFLDRQYSLLQYIVAWGTALRKITLLFANLAVALAAFVLAGPMSAALAGNPVVPVVINDEGPGGGESVNGDVAGSFGSVLGGLFDSHFDSFFSGSGGGSAKGGTVFDAQGVSGNGAPPIQLASADPNFVFQLAQTPLRHEARLGDGSLGPVTLWVNGAVSFIDSDRALDVYDGKLGALIPGIDFRPFDSLMLGVAFPYEFGNFDIERQVSERKINGIGVMPYGAWRVADSVLIAFRGGASWFDNKVSVNSAGASGEFDSMSVSGDLSGAYLYDWRSVSLIGRIGYRQIHDSTTGYTLSSGTPVGDDQSDIGQGRLELVVKYPMEFVTPFVEGRVEHEFMSPGKPIFNGAVATDDRTGGVIGAGVAVTFTEGLVGDLSFSTAVGREDFTRHTIQGNVRLVF